MRNLITGLLFTALLIPAVALCQNDSIIGKIKSVKEYVSYLDRTKQQPRLFETDGDYGHSGFINPKAAMANMVSSWYDSHFARFASYIKFYGISGNITSEIWYYKNGDEYTRFEYTYDKLNNLVENKEIDIDDHSYYSEKFYFDDYTNLKRSSLYYSSLDPTFYGYRNYNYDENNRIVQTKSFDEFGLSGGRRYKYFEDGKLSEEVMYSSYKKENRENGVTAMVRDSLLHAYSEVKYTYDFAENRTEINSVGENKTASKQILLKDENERIIEIRYDHGAILTNEYNGNGLLKEKNYSYHLNDSIVTRTRNYFYDDNHYLIKVEINEDGTQNTIELMYKFDDHNNWIQQTKVVNGQKLYKRIRKIKYY